MTIDDTTLRMCRRLASKRDLSAQNINTLVERVPALVAEIERLRSFMSDLFEDGCEYGDYCPRFVKLNHYECRPCKVRRALETTP